jgi:sugar lactone lactonase YvrE
MSKKTVVVLLACFSAYVVADDEGRFPANAAFMTLIVTPLAIEGLTGDAAGNLYTTGRETTAGTNCPVWRIDSRNPTLVVVGTIPNAAGNCNPSGITFDEAGNLYIADAAGAGTIWKLEPRVSTPPPVATRFATGVPGTNGLAFDRDGNLWTGDATTGQGRVWKISPSTPSGGPASCATAPNETCVEAFRIQPMSNEANRSTDPTTGLVTGGVGRDVRTLPPGTVTTQRQAANTLGSQPLVANGLAFDRNGDLYIADTARGAIWRAQFDRRGDLKSPIGCDITFTVNTLCLDNVYVAHPYLEGTDGIALDRAGNIWNSANERNAIVVVTKQREVVEIFRNPVSESGLRNSPPANVGNNQILEFPTSPFLLGKRFCTSNSDGDRRDNSPRAAGEINAGAPAGTQNPARGKISCMEQEVTIPGMPLPVR